jgi:hypothetical protein
MPSRTNFILLVPPNKERILGAAEALDEAPMWRRQLAAACAAGRIRWVYLARQALILDPRPFAPATPIKP